MHYAYRFRLKPTVEQRELLDYHRDTCRQLYNHALGEFNEIPESEGALTQRVRQVRDQLTDLKDWWNELNLFIRQVCISGTPYCTFDIGTNTHTPIDVESELMSENADEPCCKITRVAQAYHIRDVDAKLLQQREQGASLRELAIFFNRQVLSKALDRATQEVIGDAETIYEVLMDDDTDRARQAELRSKLARYNVDIDDVQQDFISHQTVRNHLDGCREIDTGRESTFDLEAGQKTIEWAQARSEGVIEQTIERLRNAGEVADTQTEVTQSVRVACSACGQSYRIETFLEQGGCDCRPDPD